MACKCSRITLSKVTLWGRHKIWNRYTNAQKNTTVNFLGSMRLWAGPRRGAWTQLSPVSGFLPVSVEQAGSGMKDQVGEQIRELSWPKEWLTQVIGWVIWVQALIIVVVWARGVWSEEKLKKQMLGPSFLLKGKKKKKSWGLSVCLNWLSRQGLAMAWTTSRVNNYEDLKTWV